MLNTVVTPCETVLCCGNCHRAHALAAAHADFLDVAEAVGQQGVESSFAGAAGRAGFAAPPDLLAWMTTTRRWRRERHGVATRAARCPSSGSPRRCCCVTSRRDGAVRTGGLADLPPRATLRTGNRGTAGLWGADDPVEANAADAPPGRPSWLRPRLQLQHARERTPDAGRDALFPATTPRLTRRPREVLQRAPSPDVVFVGHRREVRSDNAIQFACIAVSDEPRRPDVAIFRGKSNSDPDPRPPARTAHPTHHPVCTGGLVRLPGLPQRLDRALVSAIFSRPAFDTSQRVVEHLPRGHHRCLSWIDCGW